MRSWASGFWVPSALQRYFSVCLVVSPHPNDNLCSLVDLSAPSDTSFDANCYTHAVCCFLNWRRKWTQSRTLHIATVYAHINFTYFNQFFIWCMAVDFNLPEMSAIIFLDGINQAIPFVDTWKYLKIQFLWIRHKLYEIQTQKQKSAFLESHFYDILLELYTSWSSVNWNATAHEHILRCWVLALCIAVLLRHRARKLSFLHVPLLPFCLSSFIIIWM